MPNLESCCFAQYILPHFSYAENVLVTCDLYLETKAGTNLYKLFLLENERSFKNPLCQTNNKTFKTTAMVKLCFLNFEIYIRFVANMQCISCPK